MSVYSFEEIFTVFCAVIVFFIARNILGISSFYSLISGLLVFILLLRISLVQLSFDNTEVTVKSFFSEEVFPITHIKKVGHNRFLAGLPGRIIVFIFNDKARYNGHNFRAGFFFWPSIKEWSEELNRVVSEQEKIKL